MCIEYTLTFCLPAPAVTVTDVSFLFPGVYANVWLIPTGYIRLEACESHVR